MPSQNVFLIAGANYNNLSDKSFVQTCKNRMTRLLNASRNSDDMVFTVFDVGGGAVSQNKVDPKEKKRTWSEIKRFNQVTSADYKSEGKEIRFKPGTEKPPGVMSITDIYKFVQETGIGPDTKRSLVELSFFSHAFAAGPILVNSDDSAPKAPSRDLGDKDARAEKDFAPPNMKDADLANFRAAFSSEGIVWVWGCDFSAGYIALITQLLKSSKYRSTPPGKIKDTDTFTFKGTKVTKPLSFATVKDLIKQEMSRTYAAKIAAASGVKTFGALPGTSSEYDPKGVALPLFSVPTRKPPYSDNYSRHLKFYKTYLGVELDPENRGFAKF